MKSIKRFTLFEIKHENSGSSNAMRQPEKAGYLNTLAGPTFLNRDRWKKKYYVLTGTHLYRFKKLEDAISERSAEKRIPLDQYDVCQRDDSQAYKKDFVFVLDGAFGDLQQPKYVFAAESKDEMQDWISQLRRALVKLQQNKVNKPKRPPRSKAAPSTSSETKSEHNENEESSSRLYNPTKFRVRGPKGRRPPQKKHRLKDEGDKFRSSSLCEFDMSDSNDEFETKPKEQIGQKEDGILIQKDVKLKSSSSDNLAYRYSTSEDSLELWNDEGTGDRTHSKSSPRPAVRKSAEKVVKIDDNLKEVQLNIEIPKAGYAPTPPTTPTSPTSPSSTVGGTTGPLIYVSAKLLELSACIDRSRKQLREDVTSIGTNLSILKKKLVEFPSDYTLAETVMTQAKLAITDVKSAEDELETMTTLATNIQKSLASVQQRCEKMLKDLSSG